MVQVTDLAMNATNRMERRWKAIIFYFEFVMVLKALRLSASTNWLEFDRLNYVLSF